MLKIKEETRKRCHITAYTPEVASRLTPISLELFHFLYHVPMLTVPIFVRVEQELVEFLPKGKVDHGHLDDLNELMRHNVRGAEVCIRRGDRMAFDAMIGHVRTLKIKALQKKLPELDPKTLDVYSALSSASQLVVAGGIDPMAISHVKASAAYLVTNTIDSEVTVTTLSRMIVCDPTLYDHSATVAMIATVIATKLTDHKCSSKEAEVIAQASMFHDIGKTCVPREILNKPGKFTPAEFDIMKTHTTLGAQEIASLIEKGAPLDPIVTRVAHEHHEKWDGKGYPDGRKGALEMDPLHGIHRHSRIVTIADIYSALLMKRVYKPAFEPQDAIKIMAEESSGFDPEIFIPFLHCIVKSLNSEAQKVSKGGRILSIDQSGRLSEWRSPSQAS